MTEASKKNTMAEKYPPAIANRGFAMVPNSLIAYAAKLKPKITIAEFGLLVHITSHQWTAELPWPSVARLAKRMGCTPRYVRELSAALEKKGYLARIARVGRSNEFDLNPLWKKIEEAMEREAAANQAPNVVSLDAARLAATEAAAPPPADEPTPAPTFGRVLVLE